MKQTPSTQSRTYVPNMYQTYAKRKHASQMSHPAEQQELAASGTSISTVSNISTPDTHQHPPGSQEKKKTMKHETTRIRKQESRNKQEAKASKTSNNLENVASISSLRSCASLRAEQIALFGCVPIPQRWDHEHRRLAQRCSCPPIVPWPVMHQHNTSRNNATPKAHQFITSANSSENVRTSRIYIVWNLYLFFFALIFLENLTW